MESLALIKRLWKFNEKEPLGHTTIAVYLLLINLWDDNNKADFSISDKQISINLKISRKTVKCAKDNLRNLGLLSYKNRNGFACIYKLITNYEFSSQIIERKTPQKKTQTPYSPPLPLPKVPEIKLPEDVPEESEFLAFAKSLEIYDAESPNIDFQIKTKYESWRENGWKNGNNRPIKNWKTALKATLPYLLKPNSNTFQGKVPTIKRPKQTYNE